jgi:hypothetical protein
MGEGPPPALLLIQTLDLATVLFCLLGCLLAYGETPTVGYAIIAAIAAALSGKMLTAPDLEGVLNYGSIPSRQVTRVVVEWSAVCGVLLLLAFSLKVGELYSRAVILSWFASTAMALVITQEIQVQLARWLNRRGVVASSHVIGDRVSDLQLAANLGVNGIRLTTRDHAGESWSEIAARLCKRERTAEVTRKTKETDITVRVNLDQETPVQIDTGLGFFDHMLEQIARHGGFSLQLTCKVHL